VSQSLANVPRAGFCATAVGIPGKLPARCALSAPAYQRPFVQLGTAARSRMVSAIWERLVEDGVSARPEEAAPRFRPAVGACGFERHVPLALAEDASRTDPRFHQGGRLRPATKHPGFDALERELDRRQPATRFAPDVFGISPSGNPKPPRLSPARPPQSTEGAPRVPYAPLAILVKPGEAPLAGTPDVRASVPHVGRFGLL